MTWIYVLAVLSPLIVGAAIVFRQWLQYGNDLKQLKRQIEHAQRLDRDRP